MFDVRRARSILGLPLMAIAAGALLIGLAHFFVEGFSYRLAGIRFTSHRSARPFLIALIAFASMPADRREQLLRGWKRMEVLPAWVAAGAAVATFAIGIAYGTFVAGGADSYGYVSQARLWARGELSIDQPLAASVPWPDGPFTLTPLGYKPQRGANGRPTSSIVPSYPPGLPMFMALLMRLGLPSAEYVAVPLLGALAVWLTFLLGRRLDAPASGMAAAVWLASSPIFVLQLLQPMSDVPVTAWWLAALVLAIRRTDLAACGAGLAAAAALLTRPNLVPVVAAMVAFIWIDAGRPWSRGLRRVSMFGIGVLPACLAIAWINTAFYGSPLRSGYGSLAELFGWRHVGPNLARYPRWMTEWQSPLVYAACLAPFLWSGFGSEPHDADHSRRRRMVWLLLAVAGIIVACYLLYVPFEDWSYLRFLLPAIPLLLVLTGAVTWRAIRWLPPGWHWPALTIGCLLATSSYLHLVAEEQILHLRRSEQRYADVGRYIAGALPRTAVLIAMQESGSVRHYAGRLTIRYDYLSPEWLDRAVAFLRQHGYVPYIVLEEWEEPLFRERFSGRSPLAALDWPPMAISTPPTLVRIYDPAERDRWRQGLPIPTTAIPSGITR